MLYFINRLIVIFLYIQYAEQKALKEAEERRKFPLEQRLKQHLVGQEGAITAVASGLCVCVCV